jgi:hypothetical protein
MTDLRVLGCAAALSAALGGCGSDGADAGARPWDRQSLGAAANRLVDAVRKRDAEGVCSFFPFEQSPDISRRVCLDTVRSDRFCATACTAEDSDYVTTPTVGPVVEAVKYGRAGWAVAVQGPPNPLWSADEYAPATSAAIRRRMERAARRGYVCVTVVSPRGAPLRALTDASCILFVQARQQVGKKPGVFLVR